MEHNEEIELTDLREESLNNILNIGFIMSNESFVMAYQDSQQ